MLTVSKDAPYKTLQEVIEYAKQNPEKLTYGTGGNGSAPHFATEAFQQAADVKLYHVPYKGAGEAVLGVMSGSVDMVMVSPPSVMGNIRAGQMRALAISGTQRAAALPDVPTFAEAGLPQYGVVNWSGLAAPKGTPSEVINKLQSEVAKALTTPDVREFLDSQAAMPGGMEPQVFAQLIKEETERWREVAAKADIKRQ
jgi:tripartite-type tricarboxylate transporter receptor subunit TctC